MPGHPPDPTVRPKRSTVLIAALVLAHAARPVSVEAIAEDRAKPVKNMAPSWSPDGKKIAFASKRDGSWQVYVMNVDGTNTIGLTSGTRR